MDATDNVQSRLAQFIAAVDHTRTLVNQALADAGYIPPWDTLPFNGVWEEIKGEATDPTGEIEALREVVTWAGNNQHRFYGRTEGITPAQGFLGTWLSEWSNIGIQKQALTKFLTDAGYLPMQVLTAWRDNGVIETKKGRGFTVNVRQGNHQSSLVVIKQEAIEKYVGK